MDHSRVDISHATISCGVRQLSRISDDTLEALFAVASSCYHPAKGTPPAFFIMSDLSKQQTATSRFIDKVEELELGLVNCNPSQFNPSTGNLITVWVWGIDHEKFKQFYVDQRLKKIKGQL